MLLKYKIINEGKVISPGHSFFTYLSISLNISSRLRGLLSLFFIVSINSALFGWTSTTQQLCSVPVYATNQNQEIVALVITTAPNTGNLTSITFNTAGTTSPLTNITNAKCWYTNSCPVFMSYCASGLPVQFGATIAAPNGAITFNGSIALTTGCVYYFWLSYDIPAGATVGAVVDGQCTSVTYVAVTQVPTLTNPGGSRTISNPLPATNIVPNPSFEGICPYTTGCSVLANGLGEIGIAYPWYIPAGGTSDYQNCGTGAPLAFTPLPPPRTGNCTVGEYFYGFGSYREYVQVPLSRPLIAGNIYEVMYFVRTATPQASCFVQDCSAYFSVGPFLSYASSAPWAVTPQVTNASLAGGSAAWSQVCGCFTAVGGENYMTLGNFKTDPLTIQVGCGLGYMFIDDASVQDLTQTGNVSTCGSCAILPIELLFFKAACENKKVAIQWATASEKNNSYFVIERSRDGQNFEFVTSISGSGTTNQTVNYEYVDNNMNGTIYYRMLQVDNNGKQKYTEVIAVNCIANPVIAVYPNPSEGIFNVEGCAIGKDIVVFDKFGQTLRTIKTVSEKCEINLSGLNKGIYYIKVDSGKDTGIQKIIIN